MLDASHTLKSEANTLFSRHDYSQAISTYDRALAELPRYLDYEVAILRSNIAACHLQLEQWKDAVEACEKGLESLEREIPLEPKRRTDAKKGHMKSKTKNGRAILNVNAVTPGDETDPPKQVVELSESEDEASALQALNLSDSRKQDVRRIRVKLWLRRARARTSMPSTSAFSHNGSVSDSTPLDPAPKSTGSTWSNLSAALEDYNRLHSTPQYWDLLPSSDRKTVRRALVDLPPRIDEAKQREVGEMMGKLKDLGNTVLKPFGLSTDMFRVTQGEGGGYSLSFDGGKKG
jgi:tetratricopeptide (TPR) repeat protein